MTNPRLRLLLCTALLTGCASVGQVDWQTQGPHEGESIIVIGVKPANFAIYVFPGDVSGESFKQDPWRIASIGGVATDGYIVGRAKAGDTLAIATVTERETAGSMTGKGFSACSGSRTLVFDVPHKRVVYLADVQFTSRGSSIDVRYTQDLEAARQHVRTRFPNIRQPVETHPYTLRTVSTPCGGGAVTIPIYIPSR